jgi:hypothetical protein
MSGHQPGCCDLISCEQHSRELRMVLLVGDDGFGEGCAVCGVMDAAVVVGLH